MTRPSLRSFVLTDGTAVAAVAAGGAVAAAAAAIAPVWVGGPLLAVLALFGFAGVRVAALVYGGSEQARRTALLVGPLWGCIGGSLVLLALWLVGFRHPAAVLVAGALLSGAVLAWRRPLPLLDPPALVKADLIAVLIVVTLVPLLVGRPFSQVGREMADGVAYRAYFTADFVWVKAVVAEVAKGDVPPVNPFLRGAPLNYYWLPHLLAAAEYRAAPTAFTIDRTVLINDLGLGVLFVAFLYGFVRHFVPRPLPAVVACAFALLFVSFEGAFEMWRVWRAGEPFEVLRNANIDGLTRSHFGSVIVDGLHRLLLYQITHHGVAYVAGLSALLVIVRARRVADWRVTLLAGALLGAGLLFSSFSALMLALAAGLAYLARVVRERAWMRGLSCGVLLVAPVAVATGLSLVLHYVESGGGLVEFGLNRTAARNAASVVALSFGPLLPAAAVGLWAAWRRKVAVWPLVLVVAVCFGAYFYVNVRDHMNVYVAWRAGHILIVMFATLLGIAVDWAWSRGHLARVVAVVLGTVGALLALPTTAIDVINSQDVSNRAMGPGFRWTVVLNPGEVEALAWIRTRTMPRAVVQVEPAVRGRDTWAYIPAFGERRMAAGLPISMVPLRRYEVATERVTSIYRATDPRAAFDLAAGLGIDYLLIGGPERQAYPQFEPTVASRPGLFIEVCHTSSVVIYKLRGARARD